MENKSGRIVVAVFARPCRSTGWCRRDRDALTTRLGQRDAGRKSQAGANTSWAPNIVAKAAAPDVLHVS